MYRLPSSISEVPLVDLSGDQHDGFSLMWRNPTILISLMRRKQLIRNLGVLGDLAVNSCLYPSLNPIRFDVITRQITLRQPPLRLAVAHLVPTVLILADRPFQNREHAVNRDRRHHAVLGSRVRPHVYGARIIRQHMTTLPHDQPLAGRIGAGRRRWGRRGGHHKRRGNRRIGNHTDGCCAGDRGACPFQPQVAPDQYTANHRQKKSKE